MNWTKIDPDNLPSGRVLAKGDGSMAVGYLKVFSDGTVDVKDHLLPDKHYTLLCDATHYIALSELETLPHDND